MSETATAERPDTAEWVTDVQVTAPAPADFLMQVATNTGIDAEKLKAVAEVYITLQEKQREWARADDAERARVAFFAAKPAMQAALKVMAKDTPNPRFAGSKFTDYGDMWEANCQTWTEHGFSVSFQTWMTEGGLIHAELWLDHAAGHREVYTTPDARPGMSGSRDTTGAQDNQATTTYLQRGLISRALGIAMKGLDDDGNSGGPRSPPDSTRAMRDAPIHPTPPPPRPPSGKPVTAMDAINAAWTAEEHWKWKKLVLAAAGKANSVTELTALQRDVTPMIEADGVPPGVRTELRAAFAQAGRRLAPQPFDFVLLTAEGESPDGQVYIRPAEWARAFMTHWDATPDRLGRSNMLYHNTDALIAARQWPEAKNILANATLPPVGGPVGDSENPGENIERTADETGTSEPPPPPRWAGPFSTEITHADWFAGIKNRLADMSEAVFDTFVKAAPTKARMAAMQKDDPVLFGIANTAFTVRHNELHPSQ